MATSTAQAFTADIDIPPSPVPHLLLHPNVPPSKYESTLIHSAILDSQSSLSQLESRLTAVLREFRQKRKALRRYSQVHQRLLSRKPHIPPEILSNIFTLCLPSDWTDRRVDARAMPVLLSQVSMYWRHVAVSTPRLWSSMHVWLEPDVSDRTMNMFETWLSRTHGTLLSINVQGYSPSIEDEQTVTHPIMELILSCCHRWQHFTFDLPISLARSLSAVEDKLPCLESLFPRYLQPSKDLITFPFRNAFKNAPQLTHLTLGPYTTFSKLTVPWTQLTKFRAAMELNDVIEILHHSPNIVDIFFTCPYQKPGTTPPLVHLPYLATLVIDTHRSPANLFDCLVVPCLRNLNVSLDQWDDDDVDDTAWWDWLEPLLSLIFRSSCSIQSFTFWTQVIDFDADDLTRCLQAMPALQDLTLHLENGRSIENILCRLIHRSAEPCTIPKLMYLDLAPWHESFNYKPLIDMIQSRWRMVGLDRDGVSDKPMVDVARLKVVILRAMHSKYNSNLIARLRELKDEGLRIDLRDHRNKPVSF
jgi:F-box-like